MRSVAELVPAVGGVAFRRFGAAQGALVARWAEIVGAAYARHSRPEGLRFARGEKTGGTLEIAVTGALAPMLAHVEPQLVERANRLLGAGLVAKIRLRHADFNPAPAPAPKPPPVELSAETRSTLKAIEDPELRASLEALARALAEGRGPPIIR